MSSKSHWEQVYSSKAADSVSWYQPRPDLSLELIKSSCNSSATAIIDVGGGASTLVDSLLGDENINMAVLDLSGAALQVAKHRLGALAGKVQWLEGDVTAIELPRHSFDVWHDRAVFHFLTEESARRAYVEQVLHAVKPGGHVIIATFGASGPEKCSGLPVVRYTPGQLHSEFGGMFTMVEHREEHHITPAGNQQDFIYCHCLKAA